MAKQRKPPGRGHVEHTPARDAEPSGRVDQERGNEAAKSALVGDVVPEQALDPVRDGAFPLVERAILALQVSPPDPAANARYVEILKASQLPEGRRHALVEHLEGAASMAEAVSSAVEACFGVDSEERRQTLLTALDSVWTALDQGERSGSTWLHEHERASAEAAEPLIGDLFSARIPAELAQAFPKPPRAAILAFVSTVYLALRLDEEEDEDWGFDVEMDGQG